MKMVGMMAEVQIISKNFKNSKLQQSAVLYRRNRVAKWCFAKLIIKNLSQDNLFITGLWMVVVIAKRKINFCRVWNKTMIVL